jgi:phosphoribosylamine--glycine ligase
MKVLVIGSGGREHALAWKISQSPHVKKIFCCPGNPGTMAVAENVNISPEDIPALLEFASKEEIDLTVVGPEIPLTLGIVDEFEKRKLKVFGPKKNAAELEGSKIFAKQFMERHKIPTGDFEVVESPDQAKKILSSGKFSFPVVIKADGLAAGKGVIICKNMPSAEKAVNEIMTERKFGEAGNRVLIEEFLRGKEVSFIVITDGAAAVPLVTTMDHKAVYDGDKGPNTGGMGAISPSPYTHRRLFDEVMQTIVTPTITWLLEEGRKFKGVLYVGLMLTDKGPQVLEYNCRFGDPETQPQMLRLESDLVDLLMGSVEGNLSQVEAKWSQKTSGCVVIASDGYPGRYQKGFVIKGLKNVMDIPGITIFHAGTKFQEGETYTNGGRVLTVCASENTLTETMTKIYKTLPLISFEGMFYRSDIGEKKEENK